MLSTIEAVNSVVNNFIWGVPAMICIIGVGLYLSIRTRFLQDVYKRQPWNRQSKYKLFLLYLSSPSSPFE